MNELLINIDWYNLLAGALLSVFLGILGKIIFIFFRNRRPSYSFGKHIAKEWYSAEYDIKNKTPKNTFLKVHIKYNSFFNTFKMVSCNKNNTKDTGWIVKGKLIDNTMIGEWYTTIKGTKRYGSVFLKFLDNQRAFGYWIGLAGTDSTPKYGYWLLDKDKNKLKEISDSILNDYNFKSYDVGLLTEYYEKREKKNIINIEE